MVAIDDGVGMLVGTFAPWAPHQTQNAPSDDWPRGNIPMKRLTCTLLVAALVLAVIAISAAPAGADRLRRRVPDRQGSRPRAQAGGLGRHGHRSDADPARQGRTASRCQQNWVSSRE